MKLQRVKAREYKSKPIYKYMIVIPPKDIKELGWVERMELKGTAIENSVYILTKK